MMNRKIYVVEQIFFGGINTIIATLDFDLALQKFIEEGANFIDIWEDNVLIYFYSHDIEDDTVEKVRSKILKGLSKNG